MSEPHGLRVIEGGTGEVDDGLAGLSHDQLIDKARRLQALNDGLTRDIHLAEEGLRELRARNAGLKGRLTLLQREDPQAETIEAVMTYWRVRCCGPNSKAQTPIDGKRAEAVRKTLRRLVEADDDPGLADPDKAGQAKALASATDRAVARIQAAVDGAVRFPFEGAYGKRFAEQQPGTRRKVDLIYILRDEVKMEQFIGLIEDDEQRRAYRAELHHRLTTRPMELALFASLDPEHGELIARAARWAQTQVST